jgi:hypothetical protein
MFVLDKVGFIPHQSKGCCDEGWTPQTASQHRILLCALKPTVSWPPMCTPHVTLDTPGPPAYTRAEDLSG